MLGKLEQIARRAGALALEHMAGDRLEVEAKGPLDLVTIADKAVEQSLVSELSAAFPGDGILGEEGAAVRPGARRVWVIDPIDGTFNFVRGLPDWAVSIGLIEDGQPRMGAIYAPMRDRLLIGGREEGAFVNGSTLAPAAPLQPEVGLVALGIATTIPVERELALMRHVLGGMKMSYRNFGSTAIALMQLAEGRIDAMIGLGNKAWDIAGGIGAASGLGFASTVDFGREPSAAPIDFIFGKKDILAHGEALLGRAA